MSVCVCVSVCGSVCECECGCVCSLSCINELAIDRGGYVYEQPSRIKCSIWQDASQRSREGV